MRVVVDGCEVEVPNVGFFFGIMLLDDVMLEMIVYIDEIFGFVFGVVRVDIYEQGVVLINVNCYVNGTAIFICDGGAVRQFQFDVEVGMVGINVLIFVSVVYYFFGGWKELLFGDIYMYGLEGINFYICGKVVIFCWFDLVILIIDFGFFCIC